ncbi:MAG: PKD domain-containing protein [Candidatus Thorarchaeota archaeon]
MLTIALSLSIVLLLASCSNPFNPRPRAIITIPGGTTYGAAPFTISFDISGSNDPNGEIVSFAFDFGDGSTPIEGTDLSELIEHTYENAGSYFAKLTVTDNGGATGSFSLGISVYESAS